MVRRLGISFGHDGRPCGRPWGLPSRHRGRLAFSRDLTTSVSPFRRLWRRELEQQTVAAAEPTQPAHVGNPAQALPALENARPGRTYHSAQAWAVEVPAEAVPAQQA